VDPTVEDRPAKAERFPVAVILERRPAVSKWADHVWMASGIAVGRHAENSEPLLLREDQGIARFLVGGLQVTLHRDECESYYYNLVSDQPRAYVVAHIAEGDGRPQPFLVSVSFDEAHAYLEGEDDIFAVDLPPELYRWIEAYVIANYFPEKKKKRRLVDWSAGEPGAGPS
jgi:hypothetical protein